MRKRLNFVKVISKKSFHAISLRSKRVTFCITGEWERVRDLHNCEPAHLEGILLLHVGKQPFLWGNGTESHLYRRALVRHAGPARGVRERKNRFSVHRRGNPSDAARGVDPPHCEERAQHVSHQRRPLAELGTWLPALYELPDRRRDLPNTALV